MTRLAQQHFVLNFSHLAALTSVWQVRPLVANEGNNPTFVGHAYRMLANSLNPRIGGNSKTDCCLRPRLQSALESFKNAVVTISTPTNDNERTHDPRLRRLLRFGRFKV